MRQRENQPARITLVQGDITSQRVDAIVNAANSSLMGGGGVDGAIHRKGGPTILAECRELRRTTLPEGLPAGEAVSTTAGALPAQRVIHTVGPIWRGGNAGEDDTLARAYTNCMRVATMEQLKSVAFPSISTGAYGFPTERAAPLAIAAVIAAMSDDIEEVRFVLFSAKDYEIYSDALAGA